MTPVDVCSAKYFALQSGNDPAESKCQEGRIRRNQLWTMFNRSSDLWSCRLLKRDQPALRLERVQEGRERAVATFDDGCAILPDGVFVVMAFAPRLDSDRRRFIARREAN